MENRLSPAIQRLLQKLASDPTSRAFVSLAELYLQCDLIAGAIEVLSDGIRRHPSYVAARMMRGKLYLQSKRTQDAKEDFESVIEAHPEHVQAYKYLAHLYREMGNLNQAMEIYKRILAVDPRDPTAQHLLSSVCEEMSAMEGIQMLSPSLPLQDHSGLCPDPFVSPESHEKLQEGSRDGSTPEEASVFHRTRLQTWLASIQERRKKYELS